VTVLVTGSIPQDELHCPRCGNEELEYIGRELVYAEYVRVVGDTFL